MAWLKSNSERIAELMILQAEALVNVAKNVILRLAKRGSGQG